MTALNQPSAIDYYQSAAVEHHRFDDAAIALRVFGEGPALVLIHGYPVHGYTWRNLLPRLARHYTCYVLDLPGLGDSQFTEQTDFTFTAQANRVSQLLQALGRNSYALMGHDTGATVARLVALAQPTLINKLILINTEIPGHRPPWIRFYQVMSKLPGALNSVRRSMSSPRFLRSSMGMREFYSDKSLLDDPASLAPYVEPLVQSRQRLIGSTGYLRGIQWSVLDSLAQRHRDIETDTLFLWGEDDKTFPIALGRAMSEQFGGKTQFVAIKHACLMPHEEQPDVVLEHLLPFLADRPREGEHATVEAPTASLA